MKNTMILALSTFAVCSAFAYSMSAFPPIRSLPEAYQIAVWTLGSRTNQLVCIEGKRSKELHYWDFVFEETNASRVVVFVSDANTNGCIDCPHQ